MACYENTEIASVCGCDEKTVRTVIGESAELPKLRKDEQASAEHATDFDIPIYNIWKQQEIADAVGMTQAEIAKSIPNGNIAKTF